VLRGSFTLVLTEEQMTFFEKIAKEAFMQVMSYGLVNITSTSDSVNTVHLATDPGGIQNKRPGVYIIQLRDSGLSVIGQTKDLKKRFNQYTSRCNGDYTATINKNFYVAVRQAISKNIDYSQIVQRFVVYTWVDKKK
jgi:REP element-mobilizing transposase RayT